MTIIFGQRGLGYVTLAADTRRRDHVTGAVRQVEKIHKLSDQILYAQGGAGSGAADEVVKCLKAHSAQLDLATATDIAINQGPPILARAATFWSAHGRQIPPTSLTFASVDPATGTGVHRIVNLIAGTYDEHVNCGPFFAGSNTPLLVQIASAEMLSRVPTGRGEVRFDQYAVAVTRAVENVDVHNVGLPVDVGFVRLDLATGQWSAGLRRNLSHGARYSSRYEIEVCG